MLNVAKMNTLRLTGFSIIFAWLSLFSPFFPTSCPEFIKLFLFIFFVTLLPEDEDARQIFNFADWPVWLFIIVLNSGVISFVNGGIDLRVYINLVTNMFLLFYIGKMLFYDGKNRKSIISLICFFSGLVALLGILEVVAGFNLYYRYLEPAYRLRFVLPVSTQGSTSLLSTYLLMTIPFSFYFLNMQETGFRRFGWAILILNTACLLLTFNFRIILALIIILIFYFVIQKKYKAAFFLGVFSLLFSVYALFSAHLFYPFIVTNSVNLMKDMSCSYRVARIGMASMMLKANLLFGIDFLGFLILIIYLFKKGFTKYIRFSQSDKKRKLLFAGMASLLVLFIDMPTYEVLFWNNPYMLFCFICGMILAL